MRRQMRRQLREISEWLAREERKIISKRNNHISEITQRLIA
jgi:hypothetical protein